MALEHPQNTAIKTSDGYSITYKQLIRDATSVASELLQAGVKPGDHIALLAFPGVDAIVGQIASLMTRSCYVALDTDFAQDRLSFMISDAGSRVLLVGPGAESLASDLTSKAVVAPKVIRITEAVGAAHSSTQFSPREAQDPFYMIYTSVSCNPSLFGTKD